MNTQLMEVPIFSTYVSPSSHEQISRVLNSGFLSEGKLVKEFESRLSAQLGFSHPVAVNSGTSALHIAIVLAGIGEGDEVICPAQTFVASAMVIVQERAKAVFCDIQYETGNLCPKSIEEKITERTKAIMVVHWGGMPCDLDEINSIAKKYNLTVIEDAAHAPGASYRGRPVGSISRLTCFSFQAIKHLTTGDGGALCCIDAGDAEAANIKRWFGIDRVNSKPSILGERKYDIDAIGFKYHLNDYAAALGLSNLTTFGERLERNRHIARVYREALRDVPGIRLFHEPKDREGSYWLFGMHVERRENFIRALRHKGITASVIHQRIDRNSIFGGVSEGLENQSRFDSTQIHIPIYSSLTDSQVEHIIRTIKGGW